MDLTYRQKKPLAAPSVIIAVPVTASKPIARAMATPIGTKIIVSSAIPMVKPPTENRIIDNGISNFSLPSKAFTPL